MKYFIMFLQITFLGLLFGCTEPQFVPGTNEFQIRVKKAEIEAAESIKKYKNVAIIRSTAKVLEIKIITDGNEQIVWSPGPIKFIPLPETLSASKSSIIVLVHWDNGEWEKNHMHSIDYYENGHIVAHREASGIGVYKVILLQDATLISPL